MAEFKAFKWYKLLRVSIYSLSMLCPVQQDDKGTEAYPKLLRGRIHPRQVTRLLHG